MHTQHLHNLRQWRHPDCSPSHHQKPIPQENMVSTLLVNFQSFVIARSGYFLFFPWMWEPCSKQHQTAQHQRKWNCEQGGISVTVPFQEFQQERENGSKSRRRSDTFKLEEVLSAETMLFLKGSQQDRMIDHRSSRGCGWEKAAQVLGNDTVQLLLQIF